MVNKLYIEFFNVSGLIFIKTENCMNFKLQNNLHISVVMANFLANN